MFSKWQVVFTTLCSNISAIGARQALRFITSQRFMTCKVSPTLEACSPNIVPYVPFMYMLSCAFCKVHSGRSTSGLHTFSKRWCRKQILQRLLPCPAICFDYFVIQVLELINLWLYTWYTVLPALLPTSIFSYAGLQFVVNRTYPMLHIALHHYICMNYNTCRIRKQSAESLSRLPRTFIFHAGISVHSIYI